MNRMREAIKQSAIGPATLTETAAKQSFNFAADFIGFEGHFPDYPILPGVLQNLIAQIVAEQFVGRALRVKSIQRAKFSRQLKPDEQIDVEVNCSEENGHLHCATLMHVDSEEASSFTLVFSAGADR